VGLGPLLKKKTCTIPTFSLFPISINYTFFILK
jgi:hypothetical protein